MGVLEEIWLYEMIFHMKLLFLELRIYLFIQVHPCQSIQHLHTGWAEITKSVHINQIFSIIKNDNENTQWAFP